MLKKFPGNRSGNILVPLTSSDIIQWSFMISRSSVFHINFYLGHSDAIETTQLVDILEFRSGKKKILNFFWKFFNFNISGTWPLTHKVTSSYPIHAIILSRCLKIRNITSGLCIIYALIMKSITENKFFTDYRYYRFRYS